MGRRGHMETTVQQPLPLSLRKGAGGVSGRRGYGGGRGTEVGRPLIAGAVVITVLLLLLLLLLLPPLLVLPCLLPLSHPPGGMPPYNTAHTFQRVHMYTFLPPYAQKRLSSQASTSTFRTVAAVAAGMESRPSHRSGAPSPKESDGEVSTTRFAGIPCTSPNRPLLKCHQQVHHFPTSAVCRSVCLNTGFYLSGPSHAANDWIPPRSRPCPFPSKSIPILSMVSGSLPNA